MGERKIRSLLHYGALIRVVAKGLSSWLAEKCSSEAICWAGRQYDKTQMEGVSLVFAATSDMELNRIVAGDAAELGILCNMASNPELGSFIVPSVVEKGPLSIAISTEGLSPAISKLLRRKFEAEIGPEWDFFIRLLGRLREHFQSRSVTEKVSRKIFGEITALPVPELLKTEDGRETAFLRVYEICGPAISRAELQTMWESLWKPFS